MKTKRRKHGHLGVRKLLVVIVIISAVAAFTGICVAFVKKQQMASDEAEALKNIRDMGLSLSRFDAEYGSFPDNNTADDVKEATGSSLTFGKDFSNDYFRQLIAHGLKSEKPFWCKSAFSPHKPDDVFNSPAEALKAGEVGFSYIMRNRTDGQSSSGDPTRLVVIGPSSKDQPNWIFDPEPYNGKIIVLMLDSSAAVIPIRADNKYFPSRKSDAGSSAPWGIDSDPILRSPQPRDQ